MLQPGPGELGQEPAHTQLQRGGAGAGYLSTCPDPPSVSGSASTSLKLLSSSSWPMVAPVSRQSHAPSHAPTLSRSPASPPTSTPAPGSCSPASGNLGPGSATDT